MKKKKRKETGMKQSTLKGVNDVIGIKCVINKYIKIKSLTLHEIMHAENTFLCYI